MANFGVYLGRFSPIHLGHEAVIDAMITKYGYDQCLVIVGSSNTNQSMRHLFSYSDRRGWIKKLYPGIQVIGLPDHPDMEEWFTMLNDTIFLLNEFGVWDSEFFAGCQEDVEWFENKGFKCHYLNRFDGTTPKISATEVRDNLLQGKTLEGLVNPKVADLIRNKFSELWEQFKKK